MSTNTGLAVIISDTDLQKANEVDNAVNTLLTSGLKGLALTIAKTKVVGMIGDYLSTDVMKPVMALEGKKYGFLTDQKGEDKYKPEIVKDCFIEAIVQGVEPTGNQFNIIGGKCYITKEGCTHKLKKNGVYTNVSFGLSYKKEGSNITVMPTTIDWVLKDGVTKGTKTIEFPIRVFDKTTEQAMRGMAERDIKAWLIDELTGVQISVGNVEPNATEQETHEGGYAEEIKDDASSTVTDGEKPTLVKEEPIQSVSEKDQARFDKYIATSKDLEDFKKKEKELLSGLKVKNVKSFKLNIYNETIEKLTPKS